MGITFSKAKFRIFPMLGVLVLCSCATREPAPNVESVTEAAVAVTTRSDAKSTAGRVAPPARVPRSAEEQAAGPRAPAATAAPQSWLPVVMSPTPRRATPRPQTPSDLVTRGRLVESGNNSWLFEKISSSSAAERVANGRTGQFQQAAVLSRARADFALEAHRTGRPAPVLSTRQGVFVVKMPAGSTFREGAQAVDFLLSLPGVSLVRLVYPATSPATP